MKLAHLLTFLFLVSLTSAASAVEPLSTTDLLSRCANHERDPASLDTARCRSYLQGYMGGAYAMGTAGQTSPEKKSSKFMERAQQTRLGNKDNRFGSNRTVGYCVPPELTISEFVARLNRFAARTEKRAETANQFVLEFLRTDFTCKET
ncbi:MAG: hypothetical protein HKN70_07575 [Gammaproteobacteria bacterium]|nr:hypothetical protein [Gammaproteobacteria bacterium]